MSQSTNTPQEKLPVQAPRNEVLGADAEDRLVEDGDWDGHHLTRRPVGVYESCGSREEEGREGGGTIAESGGGPEGWWWDGKGWTMG